jgi:cytidylate kinase
MAKRIIVAIDGPAGAGKSTIARRLAGRLGFLYLDTGAMYRAVALWALRAGIDLTDMHRLERLAAEAQIAFRRDPPAIFLNGEDVTEAIRAPEVSAAASQASAIPGVRRAMVDLQRQIADGENVVAEGRDVTTVVFPEAQVKIFLDADPTVRARRRSEELRQRGMAAPTDAVAREMQERDARDRDRAAAPLMQAPDAVYLDSSGLTPGELEEIILKMIRERVSNGKEFSR